MCLINVFLTWLTCVKNDKIVDVLCSRDFYYGMSDVIWMFIESRVSLRRYTGQESIVDLKLSIKRRQSVVCSESNLWKKRKYSQYRATVQYNRFHCCVIRNCYITPTGNVCEFLPRRQSTLVTPHHQIQLELQCTEKRYGRLRDANSQATANSIYSKQWQCLVAYLKRLPPCQPSVAHTLYRHAPSSLLMADGGSAPRLRLWLVDVGCVSLMSLCDGRWRLRGWPRLASISSQAP